jgi:hypothetical protein
MERDEGTSRADMDRTSTADIASEGESEAPAPASSEEVAEDTGDRTEAATSEPLVGEDETRDVQGRWERIQGSFVDEPRRAVEEADSLVAELMQQLAQSFAQERERLESQWDRGDKVSTEDLRVALQRYRSFFDRLLSA